MTLCGVLTAFHKSEAQSGVSKECVVDKLHRILSHFQRDSYALFRVLSQRLLPTPRPQQAGPPCPLFYHD